MVKNYQHRNASPGTLPEREKSSPEAFFIAMPASIVMRE
jgi:hypothetical protein